MSPACLSPVEVRALARMARGGVHLDRDGCGVLAGRPVIDQGIISTLTAAQLITIGPAERIPRLTVAGHTALAAARVADHAAP